MAKKKKNKKISMMRALVKVLMDDFGFRKSDAKLAYKGMIDVLVEAMLRGFDVELRGFGLIYSTDRKPMTINTIFTDYQDLTVPMKRLVRFRPSESLKEALNGKRSLQR